MLHMKNTCYNVDEPRKHYPKCKKPGTKGHVLYDLIYIKKSRIGKSIETGSKLVVSKN